MRCHWRTGITMLLALTALTGIAYPLLVTGVAQVAFHAKANGSLISVDGRLAGSRLIGQPFQSPRYFWGRPSATQPVPYNGAASAGSNLGPLNPAMLGAVRARVAALRASDPGATGSVPVDLVTCSASGLDPHISPAAAEYQVPRVARERRLSEAQVRAIVAQHTEGRFAGLLGEPTVSVLSLNLALDRLEGK